MTPKVTALDQPVSADLVGAPERAAQAATVRLYRPRPSPSPAPSPRPRPSVRPKPQKAWPDRDRWLELADRELYAWAEQAGRAKAADGRSRRAPIVVLIRVAERERLLGQFGAGGLRQALDRIASVLSAELAHRELVGVDGAGGLLLLLRGGPERQVRKRLSGVISRLSRAVIAVGSEHVQVTPICGWASGSDFQLPRASELVQRAEAATDVAGSHLDLIPRRWQPSSSAPGQARMSRLLRTGFQVLLTFVLGIGVPLGVLVGAYLLGVDLATPAYLFVTLALVITSAVIWAEGLYALDPPKLPAEPAGPYPAASAVIAAYLPNEAATIVETLRAFLAQDYPGRLQVVLAYNTTRPLPVEDELRELAAEDDRLVLLKVPRSTSKSQNVNAAMSVVTGEFTGIFDADHHPQQDAYRRAWRWLAAGADVVQGHCVIRNGADSWVARTVAVEFESIYAVSHAGRFQLHKFGLFGGSNGFWKTAVLRDIRMHGHMLTEDIDSSFRALLRGRRLVYDPALISRELAPVRLGALWNQRMRWAQGWFQVSRRHLGRTLRSPELSRRNKLGTMFLLGWRELYPWLSLQIVPVVAFLIWRAGGLGNLDWAIPIFVLTSLYTLSAGPAIVLFSWRLAVPEIRKHRRWFLAYLFVATFFYTEWKNVISRVAHVKDLLGERQWIVTPRTPE